MKKKSFLNFLKQKMMNFRFMPLTSKGYTLIELLAVVGILVTLGGILSGILYSTLRGNNKSTITTAIAQNGNYALSVISNIILSSDNTASCTGQDVSSLQFYRGDGGITTLACDTANKTISSNSASLINMNVVQVDTCHLRCSQPSGDPYALPIIYVEFTLGQIGSPLFFESSSSGVFKTSVSMRNYNPR